MNVFLQQTLHAFRRLRRTPGTSALAVAVLGFGIALPATFFALVDGLILRGLPFDGADRLMHLETVETARPRSGLGVTLHDYLDWQAAQDAFEDLFAFAARTVNLNDEAAFPERIAAAFISSEAWPLLDVEPIRGSVFTAAADRPGTPLVALIGHDLWIQRFGGDPQILGHLLRVDGEVAEVLGVLPAGFAFPARAQIWLPLRPDPGRLARGEGPVLGVAGMLRPGVSPATAQNNLTTIAKRLATEFPDTNTGKEILVRPFHEAYMSPRVARILWALLLAGGLVLAIACANVASILLARSAARSQELALATALGARRGQVMGYVMSESTVLAVLGALLGLALTRLGVVFLAGRLGSVSLPYWMSVEFDLRLIFFAVGVTFVATQVAGLYPAWRASRAEIISLLRDARSGPGRSPGRFLRGLVVMEIALAFVLVICAGLMVRTLVGFNRLELGFEPGHILTATVALPAAEYPGPEDRTAFAENLRQRLEAHPDVAAATVTSHLPTSGLRNLTQVEVEGVVYPDPSARPRAHRVAVGPGFFELFAIPAVDGRLFESQDRLESPSVVVINQSLAERLWPGENPMGQRLRLNQDTPWRTIIGLVPDAWPGTLSDEDQAGLYVPHQQTAERIFRIALASRGDATPLTGLLRRETQAIAPALPLANVRTMNGVLEEEGFMFDLFGHLLAALGIAALALTAGGLFGLHAFSVELRRLELGVRLALGAERRQIVGLVLRESCGRLLLGLAIGGGMAFSLTVYLEATLFGVEPHDPWTFLAAAVLLTGVALVSSWVPAHRAARTDPLKALREG